MDFVRIIQREVEKGPRKGEIELFPDFIVGRSKDLMIRGRAFYAIWDEKLGLWSTDEYDVQRLVDEMLYAEADRIEAQGHPRPKVKSMASSSSGSWRQFRQYIQNISDNSKALDDELTFADTEVKKGDHVSKRLPYPLQPGDHSAWDEMFDHLYNPEEKAKLEWAIGAIVSGDAKRIQKFLVLYGAAGTGKSTYLDIVQKLFQPYTAVFDAKALGSSGSAFATEAFKDNPLVAIQHDGDLSRIEDNSRLNSIVSHEDMTMNEKYKPGYQARVNAFLFMGTNSPVKISDAKSGLLRRLIDVQPTGNKHPVERYMALKSRIDFELGAIAHHCLQRYLDMGRTYYDSYRPVSMMFKTDVFFNFVESCYDVFSMQEGVTLKQAYALYKEYCQHSGIDRILPAFKFRDELRNYFDTFQERGELDGIEVRHLYSGFNRDKFRQPEREESKPVSLEFTETTSLFDELYFDMPAQYANEAGAPRLPWAAVTTTLADIDTTKLHYVKVPENHIVIDFDLKDEHGGKSSERNLAEAAKWPATYGELSQSGGGVHLHYDYVGVGVGSSDIAELDPNFSDGIEVKRYRGNSALRRRLSTCNGLEVSELSSGLPVKEKKVISEKIMRSERSLRELVERNLRKEIHPSTKQSCDFIAKIMDEAYRSGMVYDLTNMRSDVLTFAAMSSNQAMASIKAVQKIKWKSDNVEDAHYGDDPVPDEDNRVLGAQAFIKPSSDGVAFYDVEVYPNLFVVCWMFDNENASIVKMINPKPAEIEELFKLKLVGFFNRPYDNHILYAAAMGYSIERLYDLSQRLISNDRNAGFIEAYSISYTDIYDFSSVKQSLKKFQVQLGLPHVEMDIPWDKPVPPELVEKVADYCANDVRTTRSVYHARKQDFVARQILAELSGLSVNDPTVKHTAKIIFGGNRAPQDSFVYTDLSEEFVGYSFDEYRNPKSEYRGEDPSEGGYVFAKPGIYEAVGVLDVASMHPTSIINLNLFGDEYTANFKGLLDARIAIKRKNLDRAKSLLGGKLAPYLGDEDDATALAYALKIVINIVYGMTSAKFPNPFRDPRNKDNIVAKRGALFMIDLKNACLEKGWEVVHIKTDSIKLANLTEEMVEFVTSFGARYGYEFEHEATYDKFCLVNDAVYIARKGDAWDAVGAQFQHPYVYKKLFSGEEIAFQDMTESRQVQKGAMYLDRNASGETEFDIAMATFVGKNGQFVPVREGFNGGNLWRVVDGKKFAVSGTSGYLWLEANEAKKLGVEAIDTRFFESLCDSAVANIERFGSFKEFIS